MVAKEKSLDSTLLNLPTDDEKRKATEKTVVEVQMAELEARKYEDDDLVTFLVLNWGSQGVPTNKKTYIDKYTGMGGVYRNVQYKHAKTWVKTGAVRGFILDADAGVSDFVKATGRDPRTSDNLVELIQSMTAEKLLIHNGIDGAERLAHELLAQAAELKAMRMQINEANALSHMLSHQQTTSTSPGL